MLFHWMSGAKRSLTVEPVCVSASTHKPARVLSFPRKLLLGAAAASLCTAAAAATIQDAVNDMLAQRGQSPTPSSLYTCPNWCFLPNVTQWAPYAYDNALYQQQGHLAPYLPSWLNWVNRNLYTPSVTPWFVMMEADGNNANNTVVEVRDVRVYMLQNSTKKWVKVSRVAAPTWAATYHKPNAMESVGAAYTAAQSNGMAVHLPRGSAASNQFIHGGNGGTTIPVNASSDTSPPGGEVRAMLVAMDYRLALKNPSGPDDRAQAKYVIDVGADYYPTSGSWGTSIIPGMGNGRMHAVTTEWKTATLLVPNFTAFGVPPSTRYWEFFAPGAWPASLQNEFFTTPPTEALTSCSWAPGTTCPSGSGTPTVPTTPTRMVGAQSNRCMDVVGTSQSNGALVNLYDCTSGYQNQLWTFRNMGNSRYQLVVSHSGKCLDVPAYSHNNGVQLQQSTCNTDSSSNQNQLWTVKPVSGTSRVQLVSVNTPTMCVDVRAYNTANGAVVQQYTCNDDPSRNQNQQWYFQQ